MRIAERAAVAAAYPQVSEKAVDHLLWALRRTLPDDGSAGGGAGRLSRLLHTYDGSLADFDPFGLPLLFRALHAGPEALADTLGVLRLGGLR